MFSDAELQMACNQEVILTKNRIIEKVYDRFGETGRYLFELLEPLRKCFPAETGVLPKISKGEQYQQLPWVMLDYPRWFNHDKGHLAIRVMFWWGNYFLVQLQVSGIYLPSLLKITEEWVTKGELTGPGWWMGFPEDPWNYRVPQPGIVNSNALFLQKPLTKSGIFKIMKVEPLNGGDINTTIEKYAVLLIEALAGRD